MHIFAVIREYCNTHTHSTEIFCFHKIPWLIKHILYLVCYTLKLTEHIRHNYGNELISSHTITFTTKSNYTLKPCCYLLQKNIPVLMSKSIINMLEIIKIYKHKCALHTIFNGLLDDFFKIRLTLHTIIKSSKKIVMSLKLYLLLALLFLCYIRCSAYYNFTSIYPHKISKSYFKPQT